MFFKRNMKFYWASPLILSELTCSVFWIFWRKYLFKTELLIFRLNRVLICFCCVSKVIWKSFFSCCWKRNQKTMFLFCRKLQSRITYIIKKNQIFRESRSGFFIQKSCFGHYSNILGSEIPQLNVGFSMYLVIISTFLDEGFHS